MQDAWERPGLNQKADPQKQEHAQSPDFANLILAGFQTCRWKDQNQASVFELTKAW